MGAEPAPPSGADSFLILGIAVRLFLSLYRKDCCWLDQRMNTSFCPRQQWLVFIPVLVAAMGARQSAQALDLDQLIPNLYGGKGITLATQGPPQIAGHAAHFAAASGNALDQLNNQLSQSFSAFPF